MEDRAEEQTRNERNSVADEEPKQLSFPLDIRELEEEESDTDGKHLIQCQEDI